MDFITDFITTAQQSTTLGDVFFMLMGLACVALIVTAPALKLTTLSALTQMGSLQERGASWSSQTKKMTNEVANELAAQMSMQMSMSMTRSTSGSGLMRPDTETEWGTRSRSQDEAVAELEKEAEELLKQEQQQIDQNLTMEDVGRQLSAGTVDMLLQEVRTQDKMVYTVTLVNIVLTGYISAFHDGRYFWLWHALKMPLYLGHRLMQFRKSSSQFMLLDLCYWLNAFSIVYVVVMPQSAMMFQIFFFLSNGCVAWSILAFGQSLVLSSLPHCTSVFIHISPALLSYVIRWHRFRNGNGQLIWNVCESAANFTTNRDDSAMAWPACAHVSNYELVSNAFLYFNCMWSVLYYIFFFVIFNDYMESHGFKTLFNRVISSGPLKHLTKITTNKNWQKLMYIISHLGFSLFTLVVAVGFWHNQWLHFLWIISLIATASWNGASFLFSVMANNYLDDLKHRAGLDNMELPDDLKLDDKKRK